MSPTTLRIERGHAHRAVLEAALDAVRRGDAATLAIVLETEGSTYVDAGAMALFGATQGQVGWLSGGCLEPEIERIAHATAAGEAIGWMEVDTRDDEDLLSGSALGCRGRLRIALLPLRALRGLDAPLEAWSRRGARLRIEVGGDGALSCTAEAQVATARLGVSAADVAPRGIEVDPEWHAATASWSLRIGPPPRVLVFGAGPETPLLLPLLRELGWRTLLAERRPRWRGLAACADVHLDAAPADALGDGAGCDAALVMHHNFELDREALQALAGDAVAFVGLLGPARRREDLFRVLPAEDCDRLLPRLHSPIGIRLGGQGPQAIALSIAAQLQAWMHGERTTVTSRLDAGT